MHKFSKLTAAFAGVLLPIFVLMNVSKKNLQRKGFTPLKPTNVFELRMERLVEGGESLSHLPDGRVCFVGFALPGELCRVQLTVSKKDFAKGIALEILEESNDRARPRCPLYGVCGGCSLQHLEPSKQAQYLKQVERENFKRLSKLDLPLDFEVRSGALWGYRNRVRVVVDNHAFSYRKQNSNELVHFKNCPVLTPGLNEFFKREIENRGHGLLNLPSDTEISLFDNGCGKVCFYYKGMPKKEFEKFAYNEVVLNDVGYSSSKIEMDASVFFQSNLNMLPHLVDVVRRFIDSSCSTGMASNAWLIDLFSGVGFFAALLKDKFKRITTVERDERCLHHAKANLKGSNVENIALPAETWLLENVVHLPATLIVDPPRTGIPKEAVTAIAKSSVNSLIYVSCNPVTLARDCKMFSTFGFTLKHAEGFAFYPQTPHLEMLCVLAR